MDVCPFCHPNSKVADAPFSSSRFSKNLSDTEDVIAKNDLCFALWDRVPVNKGHALVIPFRPTPDDYNIGFNVLRGIGSET